jgi:hypothetical protein
VPAGTSAEFVVRAWRGAATWEEATVTQTALIGQTPVFENPVGYFDPSGTPDHIPTTLDNMPPLVLYPVPEPGVLSLGVIGSIIILLLKHFSRTQNTL